MGWLSCGLRPVEILSHKAFSGSSEDFGPNTQMPCLGHEGHAGGGIHCVLLWDCCAAALWIQSSAQTIPLGNLLKQASCHTGPHSVCPATEHLPISMVGPDRMTCIDAEGSPAQSKGGQRHGTCNGCKADWISSSLQSNAIRCYLYAILACLSSTSCIFNVIRDLCVSSDVAREKNMIALKTFADLMLTSAFP